MIKKYYLKDLDVSQLPPRVREEIDKEREADLAPVAMVGYLPNHIEPFLTSKGEYHTLWVLSADVKSMLNEDLDPCYWVSVFSSESPSPRYLENILINKEQVL